jgi:exosortase N
MFIALQTITNKKAPLRLHLWALLVVFFWGLWQYLQWNPGASLLGIGALMATAGPLNRKAADRYLATGVVLLGLSFLLPVNAFIFFGTAFLLFYILGAGVAGMGFQSFCCLLIASPVFAYGVNAFSFPLRLQLARIAGKILLLWRDDIQVSGNSVLHSGTSFAVDPACMGLHMLAVSLLLGLILMGLMQRKWGRRISAKWTIFFLISLVVLNLVSNLVRILLLIQFSILPDNWLHDIAGLLCLLLYVCLPSAYLARYAVNRRGHPEAAGDEGKNNGVAFRWMLVVIAIAATLRVHTSDSYGRFNEKDRIKIEGFSSTFTSPGILKLDNPRALVYVKFLRGFYDTEHNPTVCWKGSGYEFRDIHVQPVLGREIYMARLENEDETLYTAWWFGNGHQTTVGQWDWRLDMLKGGHGYAVINVTTSSEEEMQEVLKDLLPGNRLMPLFVTNSSKKGN